MLIDFTQKIRDISGKYIMASNEPNSHVMTLADVAVNALLLPYQDEPNLDGMEKAKRFKLAMQIEKSDMHCSLSTEEIVLLKKLIGKAFNATVVGRAYDMLEKEAVEKSYDDDTRDGEIPF